MPSLKQTGITIKEEIKLEGTEKSKISGRENTLHRIGAPAM